MWRTIARLVVLLAVSISLWAQNPDTPPVNQPAPKPQFFAGEVTELDQSHIKVSRKLVGRPLESRSFLLDSKTKINKAAIKVNTRVTVRYRHADEGDTALEVQARPAGRTPKSP